MLAPTFTAHRGWGNNSSCVALQPYIPDLGGGEESLVLLSPLLGRRPCPAIPPWLTATQYHLFEFSSFLESHSWLLFSIFSCPVHSGRHHLMFSPPVSPQFLPAALNLWAFLICLLTPFSLRILLSPLKLSLMDMICASDIS